MTKLGKNSKGFGAIEALLILIIICLIVFIGYYVWHNKDDKSSQKAVSDTTTAKAAAPSKPNPYAGWKSYTLKNEKLSFKYPASWKLDDESTSDSDALQLTGTGGFTLLISAGGLGHPSFDGPTKVLAAEPVSVAGRPAYLDFVSETGGSSQAGDLVNSVSVSKSKTKPLDVLPSENPGENVGPGGSLVITLLYGNPKGLPLAAVQSSKNTAQAKLILASMQY